MSVCAPAFHFCGDRDELSWWWERYTGRLAWRALCSRVTTQWGALAWEGHSRAEDGNSGPQRKSPASLPTGPPIQPPMGPKVDQLSSSFPFWSKSLKYCWKTLSILDFTSKDNVIVIILYLLRDLGFAKPYLVRSQRWAPSPGLWQGYFCFVNKWHDLSKIAEFVSGLESNPRSPESW